MKVDIEGAEKAFERIHVLLQGIPGGVEKAMRGVIDRARDAANSKTIKGITSVYDIKTGDLKDGKYSKIDVRTRMASGEIVGMITFSGTKIPLYRFGVTPKTLQRQKKAALVSIGGEKKWVKPSVPIRYRTMKSESYSKNDNYFIAKMKNPKGKDHTGVFERLGTKDNGDSIIREVTSHSIAQMAQNSDVLDDVQAAVFETIEKRAEHEIHRILQGYGMK